MEPQEIQELIRTELPELLRTDAALREYVRDLMRTEFAPKQETEERFERMFREHERILDRLEANDARFEELSQRFEARFEAYDRRFEEHSRRLDEYAQRFEEHSRRLDEQMTEIRAMGRRQETQLGEPPALTERVDDFKTRFENSIGALCARWGIFSEESFRNGLKAILEVSFGVEVSRYQRLDREGKVFGRLDQIELDVLVTNGVLMLMELKSSMSRSDVYTFQRKVEFYQEVHQRQADRRIIISPMVDDRGKEVAESYGIEVYSHSHDVPASVDSVEKSES